MHHIMRALYDSSMCRLNYQKNAIRVERDFDLRKIKNEMVCCTWLFLLGRLLWVLLLPNVNLGGSTKMSMHFKKQNISTVSHGKANNIDVGSNIVRMQQTPSGTVNAYRSTFIPLWVTLESTCSCTRC